MRATSEPLSSAMLKFHARQFSALSEPILRPPAFSPKWILPMAFS
jgi:hypothetical protein